MKKPLPQAHRKWTPIFAIGGAIVLATGLFMLIPLTQLLDKIEEPDLSVRETRITLPPPEPPPPPEETEKPPEPQLTMPEMPRDPPPIDVPPLDLVLSPGFGEALAMGTTPPAFLVQGEAMADVKRFFTFDDLSETPRLLGSPRIRFPQQLSRRGVREGKVIVEIDIMPDGSAQLVRIVSSTHHELEPVARGIIERARFSPPIVNGEAQQVRGEFPLILRE